MGDEEGQGPSPDELGINQTETPRLPFSSQNEIRTSSWEQLLGGRLGEEFRNAMRGRSENNRYHSGYTMREFVRVHPQESRQLLGSYRRQYGELHPQILRAIHDVDELMRNPIAVPAENPRYLDLSYNLESDPQYQAIVDQLDREYKKALFGTDDPEEIKQISLERFMDLVNTDQNLLWPQQRESRAQQLFNQNFSEKAKLYQERESTRVYRDPDGVINPGLDPTFPTGLVPLNENLKLQQFAQMYPDKARAYAAVEPKLKPFVAGYQLEQMGKFADLVLLGNAKPEALQDYVTRLKEQGVPREQIKAVFDAKGIPNKPTSEGEDVVLTESQALNSGQFEVIDDGPSIVGGEIITPSARLIGETDNKGAQERGWLAAMTSAFGNSEIPPDQRQTNLQEIVDVARATGVPRETIKTHLESLGVRVVTRTVGAAETQQREATLTDEEIRRLSVDARNFVRNHPPETVQFGTGFEMEAPYEPMELAFKRAEIDPEIGRRFDAHGIAKGGYADQLRALNFLLSKGIDPSRPFHSTRLRMLDEDEAAIAGAIGAAGPYDNGAFIVIGRPDQMLSDGIEGVLVNEHFYGAIPTLQQRFPNVRFIKASEISQGLDLLLSRKP
ncbi:MAG: hypothetical protein M1142_01800 [Patescibacteria group bacterium]|nr:hypothetical protein [Patescibacteria group bacterium]